MAGCFPVRRDCLVFFIFTAALQNAIWRAAGQQPAPPKCNDGTSPTCADGTAMKSAPPLCDGGPPQCADGTVLPQPGGGTGGGAKGDKGGNGGAEPQPGGDAGGGDSGYWSARPPSSTSPHAAPMLGDVAITTAVGTDTRTGVTFSVGENIFGPFEAGFGDQQNMILEGLGCNPGSLGHVGGGIDTATAEQMMAFQCNIKMPRYENGKYVSLLDECGGHTREYHFHERLACLYDNTTGGHSTKVAETTSKTPAYNGMPVYGEWEHTTNRVHPKLDACGAHYGRTPESPDKDVYHYHTQEKPPFIIGCFGPNDDGTEVTVEQCRTFYGGCDNNVGTIKTSKGEILYDDWCPCYDASGSNVVSGTTAQNSNGVSGTNAPNVQATPFPSTGTDVSSEIAVNAFTALAGYVGAVGMAVIIQL